MELELPAIALGIALLCWRLGVLWERRNAYAAITGGVIAVLPAVLIAAHYAYSLDDWIWYLEWRARPGTELMVGLAGLTLGALWTRLEGLHNWALAIAALLILTPFFKPTLSPLPEADIGNYCKGLYCRQSTRATCGPAAAATILRHLGDGNATELDLARAARTTSSGTEIWYLARALRQRGIAVEFSPALSTQSPAIRGVAGGHFVAWLGDDIGWFDPLRGHVEAPLRVSRVQLTFLSQANTSETTRAGN